MPYSNYLYAFEIAAMLLLAAMIAAISLTFRGRRQVQVRILPNRSNQVT